MDSLLFFFLHPAPNPEDTGAGTGALSRVQKPVPRVRGQQGGEMAAKAEGARISSEGSCCTKAREVSVENERARESESGARKGRRFVFFFYFYHFGQPLAPFGSSSSSRKSATVSIVFFPILFPPNFVFRQCRRTVVCVGMRQEMIASQSGRRFTRCIPPGRWAPLLLLESQPCVPRIRARRAGRKLGAHAP